MVFAITAMKKISGGVIVILKVKKSHRDDSYIVYNPHNFALHTHTKHKRIALIVKQNVERHRVPKSNDLRLLYSHLRVTANKQYMRAIEEKIARVLSGEKRQDMLALAN